MLDGAPSDLDRPLPQTAAFARALAAAGLAHVSLPDGTLVLRRKWGPLSLHVVSRAEVTPERLTALKALRGVGPVILSPETAPPPSLALLPLVSPNHVAALDLSPDIDSLRAGLHQKWRNRLRHAEKQELRVTRQNLPPERDHWLLREDALQQRKRGYRNWPSKLTTAFAAENPGDAKLFTAFAGSTRLAGLLVLRHGGTATYHIGRSYPMGRLTSAQTLLMWEAIRWLKRKGVRRFELGLVNTEDGAGLARFKLGTGAACLTLGGTWLWWPPLSRLAHPVSRLDRHRMRGF